jgi:hypothetical protein
MDWKRNQTLLQSAVPRTEDAMTVMTGALVGVMTGAVVTAVKAAVIEDTTEGDLDPAVIGGDVIEA